MEMIRTLVDRILDVPSIIDHVAAVKYTEDLSIHSMAKVSLAADAKENPFYPVVSKPQYSADFDRFLPVETKSFLVSSGVDPKAVEKSKTRFGQRVLKGRMSSLSGRRFRNSSILISSAMFWSGSTVILFLSSLKSKWVGY